jgi:tocopherol cyclase
MPGKGFRGWYFRHRCGSETVAFIPGEAEGGAFIQMISAGGSRFFPTPPLSFSGGVIRAGSCEFSRSGIVIDLPGVSGRIAYGPLSPLKSDIMGPFAHLPMQCRHGVISMRHTLRGSLLFGGAVHCFDGGCGYIESDRGVSFPRSYLWMQCFGPGESGGTSLLFSCAHIPVGPFAFTGLICAAVCRGREYRLATYDGARLLAAGPEHIRACRGGLLLEAEIVPARGHILSSPVRGKMSGKITETNDAQVSLRLWERGRAVMDFTDWHAAFEYVP